MNRKQNGKNLILGQVQESGCDVRVLADILDGKLVKNRDNRSIFIENYEDAGKIQVFAPGKGKNDYQAFKKETPVEIYVMNSALTIEGFEEKIKSGIMIPSYLSNNVVFVINEALSMDGVVINLSQCDITSYNNDWMDVTCKDIQRLGKRCILKQEDMLSVKGLIYGNGSSYGKGERNFTLFQNLKESNTLNPAIEEVKDSKEEKEAVPVLSEKNALSDDTLLIRVRRKLDEGNARFIETLSAHQKIKNHILDASLAEYNAKIDALKRDIRSLEEGKARQEKELTSSIDILKKKKSELESEAKIIQKKNQEGKEAVIQLENKQQLLLSDIEDYEKLRDDTVKSVHSKIQNAREHMSDFIAEIAPVLALDQCKANPQNAEERWTIQMESHDQSKSNAEAVSCENWQQTRNVLLDNLTAAGIEMRWRNILAAFLYSAYINHVNILLAGPGGHLIADALSLAVTGKPAAVIACFGAYDGAVVQTVLEPVKEPVLVKNPLHSDWITTAGEVSPGNMFLWTHPLIEDLAIEPMSIYNYVLPVFTDCFFEMIGSVSKMKRGIQSPRYLPYQHKEKYMEGLDVIEDLPLGKIPRNRLRKLLAEAKGMCSSVNGDMEYLLAVMPAMFWVGDSGLMKKIEKNVTTAAKEEGRRYTQNG